MKIEGFDITGQGIANAIDRTYPTGNINLSAIQKNKWYNYLVLWAIRVSTCNTSMPDDVIGGIRLKKDIYGNDYWDILYSDASTDPSPYWLMNPMSDARLYGGTAWVAEGQYIYGLGPKYFGYPSFVPLKPVKVYRWKPTQAQIKDAKAKKIELSAEFEKAKEKGQIIIGTSDSVFIHRTWTPNSLYKDSAGCQVFANNGSLVTLTNWAIEHKNIYKKNSFSYTLLTKEDFINNQGGLFFSLFNPLPSIFNKRP